MLYTPHQTVFGPSNKEGDGWGKWRVGEDERCVMDYGAET
jgi:hypothetical protein